MHNNHIRLRVSTSSGIVAAELERSHQHPRLTNQAKTGYAMQTDKMMLPKRNAAHITLTIEWV